MDERPESDISVSVAIYQFTTLKNLRLLSLGLNPLISEIISTTKFFRQFTVTLLDSDFLLYLDNEVKKGKLTLRFSAPKIAIFKHVWNSSS